MKLKQKDLISMSCDVNLNVFCSTAKSARLRQAKEEAEREIAEYRSQMEAEFQRKVAEVCHLPILLDCSQDCREWVYFFVVLRKVVTPVQMLNVLIKRQQQKSSNSINRLQASPLKLFRCCWGMWPLWRTKRWCAANMIATLYFLYIYLYQSVNKWFVTYSCNPMFLITE